MKCINDSENDTQFSMEMITFDNYQETFNLYEENFNNQDYIQKLNTELFHILYSRTEENRKVLFLDFYSILAKTHDYNEGNIRLYMLLHLDPILADEIFETIYPGLTKKFVTYVDRKKVVEKFDDKMIEKDTTRKTLSTMKRILLMQFQYVDLIKDTYLVVTMFNLLGGPYAVFSSWTQFSSVICLTYLLSVILPSMLGTFFLSMSNPGLIFLKPDMKLTLLKKMLLVFCNLAFCFINPILIINSCEHLYEQLRSAAKRRNVQKTVKTMKSYHRAQVQRSEFVKLELGMDIRIKATLKDTFLN